MTQTVTAPMTWGARHPIVLLPDAAEEWSEECRRVVLRHEFAHIQRNDWLFHTLSRIACAVYWLNPLAWIATRRLSIERERACDDAVISLGTKPSEYAKHLVDIAQSMTTMRSVPAVALTMARLSQLEGRIVDVLRPTGKANRRAAWLGSIGMAGLLVAVTVVEPSGSTWGAKEESPRGHAVAPVADIRVVPHIVDVATESARHVISVRPVIAPTVSVRTVFVPKLSYVPLPPLPMEYLSGMRAPTSNDDCSYYRVERDDDHVIFEMKNDDVDLYLETRGDVEFSDDGTAITKMGKRSKVVIESREGRDLFEIVIRPGDGDKLTYDWRVNDKKREFDRKGEEWLEMVLSIVHDHLTISELAGTRNALAGEINAIFGERNVVQGLINTLLGELNAYEGEINRLMGDRNHQIDRLRMIESEERELMQTRREIEKRMRRGENVTEDLDRTMLELIDEQLGELQKASSQIRENMDLRAVVIDGDDLLFDASDWEDRMHEMELLRDDFDVQRRVHEIEERMAALDVSGQVEAINEKILQMQIEKHMTEVQKRVQELAVNAHVKDLEGKIKGLDVGEKVKDLENEVKAKYRTLDRIQRDLI